MTTASVVAAACHHADLVLGTLAEEPILVSDGVRRFAALLPILERVLGPEHPYTLTARDQLAHWTGQAGDAADDPIRGVK